MSDLVLVIGNKAYSSWSLRPWLFLKHSRIPFSEVHVSLDGAHAKENLQRHSPSGKVPVLRDGALTVWDSFAICQYLTEKYPQTLGWPKEAAARATAYSVAAEMHSGFLNLRREMPMNCRAESLHVTLSEDARKEVARVKQIWRDCRTAFGGKLGSKRPWLFGEFGVADAFYAPVALRFKTYGIELDPVEQAYADAILSLPEIRSWIDAAKQETEGSDPFSVGVPAK